MNIRCPQCKLINFADAAACVRCHQHLIEVKSFTPQIKESTLKIGIFKRAVVCLAVCLFVIFGFYLSLVGSSKSLKYDEKQKVTGAINILSEKGFSREAFLLNYLTAFRANDNWLNASIEKENAYAATNFPLEIMTIYEDFFTYPVDDTERAAILLHEAQHLKSADEKEAYRYVWENRVKLGWTREKYENSAIFKDIRRQTREIVPELFVCETNTFNDCTEM